MRTLRPTVRPLAVAFTLALGACTSGNSAVEPPFQSANLADLKLQFAVGTANIGAAPATSSGAQRQFVGLNTVVTFRQPNGLSGVLLSTPDITGPPGFRVPRAASDAGTDAGTNHISGAPQTIPGSQPPGGTFGQMGGAFGFGFAPDNTDTFGSANCGLYTLPFYAAIPFGGSGFPLFGSSSSSGGIPSNNQYVGGPPAFPTTQNGTVPPCTNEPFLGYSEGFIDFAAVPISGAYGLKVTVPTASGSNVPTTVFTTSARLNANHVLPPLPPPSFVEDGKGGGTATVDVPSGVSETFVEIYDLTGFCHSPGGPQYYTLFASGAGVHRLVLPDALGAGLPSAPTPSLCIASSSSSAGDIYLVYAAGVDFPDLESSYPKNRAQTPPIVGAAGQADVTTSFPTLRIAGSSAIRRR